MNQGLSDLIFKRINIRPDVLICKSKRPTIKIKITADAHVSVSMSKSISHDELLLFVESKKEWLYRKIGELQQRKTNTPILNYSHGETHYYLGERYTLCVLDSTNQQHIVLDTANHQMLCRGSAEQIKVKLQQWYKHRAIERVHQRIAFYLPQLNWVKQCPDITIRAMRSRWGSCSSKGKININMHLMKAPPECIDYVILHELCHLKELNHGPRFYQLLAAVYPDWKAAEQTLKGSAHLFLNA